MLILISFADLENESFPYYNMQTLSCSVMLDGGRHSTAAFKSWHKWWIVFSSVLLTWLLYSINILVLYFSVLPEAFLDISPITWSRCDKLVGGGCILYLINTVCVYKYVYELWLIYYTGDLHVRYASIHLSCFINVSYCSCYWCLKKSLLTSAVFQCCKTIKSNWGEYILLVL